MSEQGRPPLVDIDRLAGWMDARGLGGGAIEALAPLTGGTQNFLARFRRDGRDYVLRRPPAHPRPNSNEAMRREARLLAALASTDVPHPRLIAACDETEPLGVSFFLMEAIDGFNATEKLPEPHASDAAIRRRMGLSMVESIAALHRVDYIAAGLGDFGRPEGYLERQVARWKSQLDGYRDCAGWPGRHGLPGVDEVADWLEKHLPPASPAGIVHGDYQFANVLFRRDNAELAAIIDWELASIGDPLVDLGWLVATWRGAGGPELPVLRVEPWEGFVRVQELAEHYAKLSSRDLTHIEWYVVLACYRLGILLEGTYARACAGRASVQTGALLHETAVALFGRALHRMNT